MGRLYGLGVWNGLETLSVMTKRDWSSIHGEVKEAESMKTTVVVWVPGWNPTKRKKKPLLLSLSFFDYIYILMHCENRRLLNACMAENRMCLFA